MGEFMTHRSDMIYLDINDDLDEIRRKVESEPHAVYPVVDKSPDKLLGIVSVNQIFTKSFSRESFKLGDLLQPPQYVQENLATYKVLNKFREHKIHMVLVVDEYG